jgi:hypothetical protein
MVTGFGIVWLVGHGCCTSQLYMWRRSVQIRIDHPVPLVGQVTSEVAPGTDVLDRPDPPRRIPTLVSSTGRAPATTEARSGYATHRARTGASDLIRLAITTQRALVRHRPQIQNAAAILAPAKPPRTD